MICWVESSGIVAIDVWVWVKWVVDGEREMVSFEIDFVGFKRAGVQNEEIGMRNWVGYFVAGDSSDDWNVFLTNFGVNSMGNLSFKSYQSTANGRICDGCVFVWKSLCS